MIVRACVHHLIIATQRGECTKQMVESVKGHLACVGKSNPGDAVRLSGSSRKSVSRWLRSNGSAGSRQVLNPCDLAFRVVPVRLYR